ncbi:hypothetical protein FKM82_007922 [Ascaphus truei]
MEVCVFHHCVQYFGEATWQPYALHLYFSQASLLTTLLSEWPAMVLLAEKWSKMSPPMDFFHSAYCYSYWWIHLILDKLSFCDKFPVSSMRPLSQKLRLYIIWGPCHQGG